MIEFQFSSKESKDNICVKSGGYHTVPEDLGSRSRERAPEKVDIYVQGNPASTHGQVAVLSKIAANPPNSVEIRILPDQESVEPHRPEERATRVVLVLNSTSSETAAMLLAPSIRDTVRWCILHEGAHIHVLYNQSISVSRSGLVAFFGLSDENLMSFDDDQSLINIVLDIVESEERSSEEASRICRKFCDTVGCDRIQLSLPQLSQLLDGETKYHTATAEFTAELLRMGRKNHETWLLREALRELGSSLRVFIDRARKELSRRRHGETDPPPEELRYDCVGDLNSVGQRIRSLEGVSCKYLLREKHMEQSEVYTDLPDNYRSKYMSEFSGLKPEQEKAIEDHVWRALNETIDYKIRLIWEKGESAELGAMRRRHGCQHSDPPGNAVGEFLVFMRNFQNDPRIRNIQHTLQRRGTITKGQASQIEETLEILENYVDFCNSSGCDMGMISKEYFESCRLVMRKQFEQVVKSEITCSDAFSAICRGLPHNRNGGYYGTLLWPQQ